MDSVSFLFKHLSLGSFQKLGSVQVNRQEKTHDASDLVQASGYGRLYVVLLNVGMMCLSKATLELRCSVSISLKRTFYPFTYA